MSRDDVREEFKKLWFKYQPQVLADEEKKLLELLEAQKEKEKEEDEDKYPYGHSGYGQTGFGGTQTGDFNATDFSVVDFD